MENGERKITIQWNSYWRGFKWMMWSSRYTLKDALKKRPLVFSKSDVVEILEVESRAFCLTLRGPSLPEQIFVKELPEGLEQSRPLKTLSQWAFAFSNLKQYFLMYFPAICIFAVILVAALQLQKTLLTHQDPWRANQLLIRFSLFSISFRALFPVLLYFVSKGRATYYNDRTLLKVIMAYLILKAAIMIPLELSIVRMLLPYSHKEYFERLNQSAINCKVPSSSQKTPKSK